MASYCEEQYINSLEKKVEALEKKAKALEKQCAERDFMIDWLAAKAYEYAEAHKQGGYCSYADGCSICLQNRNMPTPYDWKAAAREALKKYEN